MVLLLFYIVADDRGSRTFLGRLTRTIAVGHSRIQFLEPWCELAPDGAEKFLAELRRELSPDHALAALHLVAIGHSGAADDAIFEAEDGRIFEVHLTWSRHPEHTPLPSYRVFSSVDEWIQQVMLIENKEYRGD